MTTLFCDRPPDNACRPRLLNVFSTTRDWLGFLNVGGRCGGCSDRRAGSNGLGVDRGAKRQPWKQKRLLTRRRFQGCGSLWSIGSHPPQPWTRCRRCWLAARGSGLGCRDEGRRPAALEALAQDGVVGLDVIALIGRRIRYLLPSLATNDNHLILAVLHH
jgi:hypothetical protein